MAFYPAFPQLPRRFRLVQSSFMGSDGLAFADALPEDRIQQVFDEEGANFGQDEDAIYTPAVTLWASLTQTLFQGAQRSYAAAVARVCVLLVTLGKEPPSGDTGAYCRARAKLPERGLRRLSCELADNCEQAAPRGWFWRNRHVKLVDGFTASMPDSEANRAVYPKQTGQKEGLGFPIARMVVLLSLCTGMLCGMAIGPYEGKETGEPALLRQLLGCLKRGDIVLSDRFYCSYFMVCLLLELGVDFVVRLHQRRKADFTRGKRLGEGDHIVTWKRPERPEWMDEETYQRMPESIEVREILVTVSNPGCRAKSLVVVTTLLDAKTYTKDDVAELYHQRWLVELDIRAIKCTMDIDVLRCKSPEMVHREIWSALLAYNLIRKTILEASCHGELGPRQLSFTAAMQRIAASHQALLLVNETTAAAIIECHLTQLACEEVGNRPNRVEPRAVKRRPKPHALLTKPRDEARAELLAGNA